MTHVYKMVTHVYKMVTHLFQNQCFLNMKGHSSRGTPLVSTKKKPTNVVMQTTQMAKKRKVAHCSTKQDMSFCKQEFHTDLGKCNNGDTFGKEGQVCQMHIAHYFHTANHNNKLQAQVRSPLQPKGYSYHYRQRREMMRTASAPLIVSSSTARIFLRW